MRERCSHRFFVSGFCVKWLQKLIRHPWPTRKIPPVLYELIQEVKLAGTCIFTNFLTKDEVTCGETACIMS